MPESATSNARTVVLGERELAIGFRLIGMQDVLEVGEANAVSEFQRVMDSDTYSLVIASQSVRDRLNDAQRARADASLEPLVVFVPTPTGAYDVNSLDALAKRVLGVSLSVAK